MQGPPHHLHQHTRGHHHVPLHAKSKVPQPKPAQYLSAPSAPRATPGAWRRPQAHLCDHVFPHLPVRQWVLSVPKRLRYYLQRDKGALNAALRIFLRVVQQSLQAHCTGAAKADPASLHLGAVAFIHRFGSSLNTHVHFHVCVVDGVFEAVAGPIAQPVDAAAAQANPEPGAAHTDACSAQAGPGMAAQSEPQAKPKPRPPAHYLWAALIARIYEVFPLICQDCGGPMRIIAFITFSADIHKILDTSAWTAKLRALPRHRAGPPLWDDCGARESGEGVDAMPDWDMTSQPTPDYPEDQPTNW